MKIKRAGNSRDWGGADTREEKLLLPVASLTVVKADLLHELKSEPGTHLGQLTEMYFPYLNARSACFPSPGVDIFPVLECCFHSPGVARFKKSCTTKAEAISFSLSLFITFEIYGCRVLIIIRILL